MVTLVKQNNIPVAFRNKFTTFSLLFFAPFFFDFVVCFGAKSGQIVIHSPQESKRREVKTPIQHLQ